MSTLQKIDDVKIIFLICFGRSGSGFLHSLLDSHKEVVSLPLEFKFYEIWDRLGCKDINDAQTLTEVWCTNKSTLWYLKDGIPPVGNAGNRLDLNYNFDLFKRRLYDLLSEKELSRRNTFLAIHQAHAETIGQNIDDVKAIVQCSALHIDLKSAMQDFKNASVLQILRDHRANYASFKQLYLNTRRDLVSYSAKGLVRKAFLIRILNSFLLRSKEFSNCMDSIGNKRFLLVQLEDLHTNLEATMRKVAKWINISFTPSLLESTLNGLPWMGNSAFKKPVHGANTEVINRWKKTLSGGEISLIEHLFYEDMQKYGYQFHRPLENKSKARVLIKSLVPFKKEILCGVPREKPKSGKMKALWEISPFLVLGVRFAKELFLISIRIFFYFVARFYFARAILCKKYMNI